MMQERNCVVVRMMKWDERYERKMGQRGTKK